MNVSTISNTPTIPIKPVAKRKFTPLIVSCFNNEAKTQLKLYDVSNFNLSEIIFKFVFKTFSAFEGPENPSVHPRSP